MAKKKANKMKEEIQENVEEQVEAQAEQATTAEEKETQPISAEEQLQKQLDEEKDKYLRLFAEFENYKKRTSKERIELFKTAGQEVISAMLPVVDDFDRGIAELEKLEDSTALEGMQLIHNKLKDTLKAKGLEQIEVNPGDDFDVDFQEAITQIPAPTEELKGKVIDCVEKGYKLGDKVIRYAKVVIGQQ